MLRGRHANCTARNADRCFLFLFLSLEGYNIQTTTFVSLTFAKQLNVTRGEKRKWENISREGFQMIIGIALERMQMEICRNVRCCVKRVTEERWGRRLFNKFVKIL